MFRLFVGLRLPDAMNRNLAKLCHGLPGARWVDPENYHMTLRFIGAVNRHTAADIDGTLQRIDAAPIELTLLGLGTFGQGRKTRALWAGAEPSAGLVHLHNKIESAVVRAGQPPETRKFIPHVTIARFRDAHPDRIQSFIERNALFHTGPVTLDRFILFESHLGKGGSHYEELSDYPLYPPPDRGRRPSRTRSALKPFSSAI